MSKEALVLHNMPCIPNCINILQGDSQENRSFDYFRSKAAPNIATSLEADFWTLHVLQISHNEPTVRHALMALSTLYEHFEVRDTRGSNFLPPSHHNFALKHYSEAIKLLDSKFREGCDTVEIVLVNCVLFVCLELLLGGPDEALTQ